MAKAKRVKKTGRYVLDLPPEEMDVIYRLLKCTKQNEDASRLLFVKDILVEVEKVYGSTLSYEDNEALSSDHFGMVCFSHVPEAYPWR